MLDIDGTCDTVHGHQQLSLFNPHCDERCFLPIHIYEAQSGKPVAIIRRGVEVRTVLEHIIKRIRRHWLRTHILVRGDSHYGRVEAVAWCEQTPAVDHVFGFASNQVLKALTHDQAQALARAPASASCATCWQRAIRASSAWRVPTPSSTPPPIPRRRPARRSWNPSSGHSPRPWTTLPARSVLW